MAEQSRKFTMYIFLFVIFILLTFYIAAWIYNNYTATKTYSDDTTKSVLECAFSFSISKIQYANLELSMEIESRFSEEKYAPKKILIEIDGIEYPQELGEYFDFKQKINIPEIVVEDTFLIYPEGCKGYNMKICNVHTRECSQSKTSA